VIVKRLALLALLAVGCTTYDRQGRPISEPEFYAKNVKAYGETAAGLPPETVYASQLRVTGDEARYFECTAVDTCTKIERTRAAKELLGVKTVGKAAVDGENVEVVELSLAPRPTYIVPTVKPTPAR
jgi:hypothetical protein